MRHAHARARAPLSGALALGLTLMAIAVLALRESSPPPPSPPLAPAPSATTLGFLGAMGRGAPERLALPDPNDPQLMRAVGGVIVESLEPGSPLAKIGLAAGDIIVRTGEHWIPVKEDPTGDLMQRIEGANSAGLGRVKIVYLRGGTRHEAELAFEVPSVVAGLPGRSERFAHAAKSALVWFTLAESSDGTFETATAGINPRVATSALVGLCYLASGDPLHANPLAACLQYVSSHVGETDHLGAAYATLLLAEAVLATPDPAHAATLARAVEIIAAAQEPSGAWPAAPPGVEIRYCDRTFATTACLFALGAAERAGAPLDNAKVQLGIEALEAGINGGYPGYAEDATFDRRSESARAAVAVVAYGSLSVRLTEPVPIRLIEYWRRHAREIPRAPTTAYPGILAGALCARRLGLPAWLAYNAESAVGLLALQRTDGSFGPAPGETGASELPFLAACKGPAWRTAHGALALLLDQGTLPVLRLTQPGWSRERDGAGELASTDDAANTPVAPPSGDKQFGSIEEAIRYMKDTLGLKDDDPQIQALRGMMGSGSD